MSESWIAILKHEVTKLFFDKLFVLASLYKSRLFSRLISSLENNKNEGAQHSPSFFANCLKILNKPWIWWKIPFKTAIISPNICFKVFSSIVWLLSVKTALIWWNYSVAAQIPITLWKLPSGTHILNVPSLLSMAIVPETNKFDKTSLQEWLLSVCFLTIHISQDFWR